MSLVSRNSFFVGAFLALIFVANSAFAQSKDPISTKYIAKETFMVLSLQPSKIAACADQKSETTKYVIDVIKKFSGLEVKKLDQILLQIGAGKGIEDEEEAVIVTMHFSEAADMDAITKKMGEEFNYEKTEKDGKPLFKPEDEDQPYMFFPDKKTLVMCLESRLDAALAGGKNDAAKMAKTLTTSDHIGVAFNLSNEDQQEFVDKIFEESPLGQMGLDTDLIKSVKSGHIHINLKSNDSISATMVCKDSKSADAMVEAGKEALEAMTEGLEQAETQLDQAPPGIAEVAEEVLEVAFKAIENTKIQAKDSKVTVNTQVKGGLIKMVDGVAKGVEQMMKMFDQLGGG